MRKLITAMGLMSGTSGDGIDVSLIKSDGEDFFESIKDYFYPFDANIKIKIRTLKDNIEKKSDLELNQHSIDKLEKEITILHADAIKNFLIKNKINKSEIDVVGFHGQTILHSFKEKISRQLADGKLLSDLLNLNVVYDFRKNDIENGGHGAPLVPIFHKLIQKKNNIKLPTIFVNIGGISNITYLGKENEILSFDSGPGNFLIDKFLQLKSKNKIQFDEGGNIASKGHVNKIILKKYLNDPYYKLYPPKSLDVNDFSLGHIGNLTIENSTTTLTDLTAYTIVNSLNFFKENPLSIIISGGGRKNNYILNKIRDLSNIDTHTIDIYKIDGDFLESQAFGYLAIRSLLKKIISFPETTGVDNPITGGIFVGIK